MVYAQGSCYYAYADDIGIIIGANSRVKLETRRFSSEYVWQSFSTSPVKTLSKYNPSYVFFSNNIMEKSRPVYKINNVKIKVLDNIIYFGLPLASKFSWMSHFDRIRINITNFVTILHSLRFKYRGIRNDVLKIWYRNSDIYTEIVWYIDLRNVSEKRQSSCSTILLLGIVKTHRSTSRIPLKVLAGIILIHF